MNGTDWDALGDQDTFDVTADCHGKKHDSTDIASIYQTTDTLVALGRIYCRGVYATAAWLSDDAVTWHRADEPMPVDRVIAGQDGYLGLQILGQTEQAWHSTNGLAWTMSSLGTQPMNAAAIASGYVDISTSNGNPPASLMTSVDGDTWTTVDDAFKPMPATVILTDGNRAAFVAEDGTAMVSSPDGNTWDAYPLPVLTTEEADSVYVSVLDDRLLLASYDTPRLWVAQIP
jgi:hypothetical protein